MPKWNTLEHNGVYFKEYIPHKIPIVIKGNSIILNSEIEEYATIYSKYIGTPYIYNKTFTLNFWKDFKKLLKNNVPNIPVNDITLNDVSFDNIYNFIKENKQTKATNSTISDDEKEKYKYCTIDGIKTPIANYIVEPPSIFIGRGEHPKMGRLKRRIKPNDVSLNISKGFPIPTPNVNGKWKEIVHDKSSIWIASWYDEVTDKIKYVYPSMESILKSESDLHKFNTAKKLKNKIKSIRKKYMMEMGDIDMKIKQLALAIYFLDKLGLRIGSRIKDSKLEADSVGLITLRVEHIELLDDNTIRLDFFGKDYIRYTNKIKLEPIVYNALTTILKGKKKDDMIFDLINIKNINDYLNEYMNGLTSKVFRTYNASILFQSELSKSIDDNSINSMDENKRFQYLIDVFKKANASVAIFCNHQKGSDKSVKLYKEKLKSLQDEYKNDKKDSTKVKINKLKDKLKTAHVSLSTSKDNYIDPRIIISFVKKYNIPMTKVFSASAIKRFQWAIDVPSNYVF